MRKPGRLVFDFQTNRWVHPDEFNSWAKGRESDLAPPESDPAEGRWYRPEKPAAPIWPLVVLLGWGAVFLIFFGLAFRSLGLVAGGAVAAAAALLVQDVRRAINLRITRSDRRLLEDPDDLDVCLVHLQIFRDGRSVGKDKGVVWFADGLLLYSGHRTSFAIGGEDVLPRAFWSGADFPLGVADSIVPLRVREGKAHLVLRPLVDGRGFGAPREMRFLKRLYAFRHRPPRSRASRQWPPFGSS